MELTSPGQKVFHFDTQWLSREVALLIQVYGLEADVMFVVFVFLRGPCLLNQVLTGQVPRRCPLTGYP